MIMKKDGSACCCWCWHSFNSLINLSLFKFKLNDTLQTNHLCGAILLTSRFIFFFLAKQHGE
jgi:hypothetical protein